ncbi:unnamed protein product [Cochlearia groenlandica]
MSPPSVEIKSPIESVSSFKNPPEKKSFSSYFTESVQSHDQSTMDPLLSFGFGAGSGDKTKSRSKPRLVKLRKNGRKVKGTSFSGDILSGFNPFATTQSKGSVYVNNVESPKNSFFVFGSSGAKASSCDDEEFSTPVGDFVFGSEHNKERSENSRPCSESTACRTSSNSRNADGKPIGSSECNLPVEMKKLNISDPRVHDSNDAKEAMKANSTPAFVFGSDGKVDDVEYRGAAKPEPWSFSSSGFHGGDSAANSRPAFHFGTNNKNYFTSTAFGTKTSFDDFKVPQWDPSALKSSLFPELRRKPFHARRNRLSKDKRSSLVKEKVKQWESRCNDQTSKGIDSQEKLSSPRSSSPMDFSPYEGEKGSNQFPAETPLTSIDPLDSRKHVDSGFSNNFKVASARDPSAFAAANHGSTCMPTFSFSASTFHVDISNKKQQAVKKYRRKGGNGFLKKNLNATMRNNQENQPVNTGQAKQESGSTSVMPHVCEVWRLRGNQAYKNGDMHKAEECYTHGINSSASSDNSESSVRPLALCYGNRAATRISLGRLREAISDCEMAASLDPSYIKAYMRAANCHLVLGELESAVQYFNKCMESAASVCLDRRTTIESAEGLQQAQRVAEFTNSASIFLGKRTPNGASDALVPIASALSISSCSDKLLQMKADALFMIRKYKEVIELCENTLQTAERNSSLRSKHHSLIVWRWNMTSKSHFYLGNLELALDILKKLQQMESSLNENQEECRDSPASLVATISELLRYKNAGNEAVRAGKYMEAVEQYTSALSRNVDSRPFAAICFCNRAAANQALVQIADAIADCSLAMALDENYTKAVSRRATLHEMIRDYDQASSDLQRLVSILVKQSDEKTKTPESSADRTSSRKELKQARQRLSVMEEKSKEGIPLDFFLIMGVKTSDTAADIKKAYRKAALRHHPDKAAQILVRSESEGPWLKEILEEVHKGADRLFKAIGEAYSVLSDPTKKSEYELEEEIRKAKASRESYRSRGNRKAAEASSSPSYQTSPSRRYWKESERTYRNTPSWW